MEPGEWQDAASVTVPLVFESILRRQIWGGRALGSFLGKTLPDAEPYGESWEISPLPDYPSRVADGPHRGRTLIELWNRHAKDLCGSISSPREFPFLVKWLDCHDRLSVQVHPDDNLAKELPGQATGKSEAWVVVHAAPDARVFAGLRAGVTRSEFEAHLACGTVLDCLHSFSPNVGDCISIPAGTVHSAQGELVFAEVQQPSNASFRLYDWNRTDFNGQPRTLHRDLGLRAIHWPQPPVESTPPQKLLLDDSEATGELLLSSRYFGLQRFRVKMPWLSPYPNELTIWMVLQGSAELVALTDGSRKTHGRGATILVPAACGPIRWQPVVEDGACTLLCVRMPSSDAPRFQ